MKRVRVGIDLGGTKIESVLMDAAGAVLDRNRIDTPRFDYAATCAALCDQIGYWDRVCGGRPAVGIGTPGVWDAAAGTMQNCNSTWLNGRPLLTDLIHRVGARVRFANDADCFALSEAIDGAGAGASPVFGAILGTGVGGGIVVGERLLQGANGIAGEWGHTPLPYLGQDPFATAEQQRFEAMLGGRDCYCGRRSCVETFLSGPGLALTHRTLWGEDVNAAVLAALGTPRADATLGLYARMLARALAQIVNVVDPAVIVLGGGLSNLERLYCEVPLLWQPYLFSARVVTRVLRARHGAASGVRGAAWLWPADYTLD